MKLKLYLLSVMTLLAFNANAIIVMPEIRTVVSVANKDISRIQCVHGRFGGVYYAKDTGLTHNKTKNGKNVTLLFQQLDTGIEQKIINSKVNLHITCGSAYYLLVLNPVENNDTPTIRLQLPDHEIITKKQTISTDDKEQTLVALIKQSRASNNQNNQNKSNNKDVYIGKLQLKLSSQIDVVGTPYQLKKFTVISNQETSLTDKIFLNTTLSSYPIAAISLDDYQLNNDKNWTILHMVINKGGN